MHCALCAFSYSSWYAVINYSNLLFVAVQRLCSFELICFNTLFTILTVINIYNKIK